MRYLLTSLLCVFTLSLTAQEAGCTYQQADNFSPTAIFDDGTCVFFGGNQDDCPNTFDGDGDGNVAITDLLGLLAVFGDTDQDADGVWDSLDDCIDFAACNYFADPSEFCQYLDVIGVCGGDCTEDDDSDLICDDVDECVGYYDECEVCNGSGIPEGYCDCFGSVLDECGTCDDDPTNDCVQDCNGEWGGTAVLDECDTCDSDPTNDCVQDCNLEWGGTAVVDECGTCDSDPSNDCVQDCNGDWGGVAALDECGVCDEDVTNDCVQDCNEEWGGTALLDECGVCDSDSSNDCVQDCNGVWGGTSVLDECGVCDGPGPTEIVIESITILYDSLYAEQIDEWWVYEVGADTVFNYTCAHSCGDDISHEGYNYSTVQIGEQCWFSENCRYLPSVSSGHEGSNTSPYYYVLYYFGTDVTAAKATENYETYGVLYNWPAVMTEGICPSGWYIPSDGEFTELTDFLGGEDVAGGKMKDDLQWDGSNSSGFSGLPGGQRLSYGFDNDGTTASVRAFWWSASESGSYSWARGLGTYDNVSRFNDSRFRGFSARCIRCEADEDGDGVCDVNDECIDNTACNFEAVPSEPCEYTSCAGCMDSSFCNYDSTATIDDGSCEGDSDGDGICDSQDNCDGVEDECGVCNGPGPTELVIDTITLLYDSIYSEAISEWWVFETGADTTYTYVCNTNYSLTVEASPAVHVPGNTIYRFYVNMVDPTDKFSAVFGNDQDPLVINTPDGIFNSPFNASWSASGLPSLFVDFFPEMAEDSYATIGLIGPASSSGIAGAADPSLVEDTDLTPTISDFFVVGAETSLNVNTLTGGSWYVNDNAGNALPDADLRVLVMQVTTTGDISGTLNYRIARFGIDTNWVYKRVNFEGAGTFSNSSQINYVGCTDPTSCNFDYFASDDDGSCEGDSDGDGICDSQDNCDGVEDECGVCNGPGFVYECGCAEMPEGACDCAGNVLDECGVCGGGGSSCALTPITDANIHEAVDLWLSDEAQAIANYGHISDWDVSNVTDMSNLFEELHGFNGDISSWDVSSVTNMDSMFDMNLTFNGDISAWDVSSVTNMNDMFISTPSFNGDLSAWDVSSVTNMNQMFEGASSFNGDISSWDVSSVTNMDDMFDGASSFNGDISSWDVSSVTNMDDMFDGTSALSEENQCSIHTSFSSNSAWPYDWSEFCPPSPCGDLVSHDGYDYSTVQIGDQCWFSENCRYLPEVSPSSEGSETEPYYYVNGYEGTDVTAAKATANYATYGVLYNWPAVMTEGICPSGWHIPSDEEFTELTDFLGGESVAGDAMKSTSGWSILSNGNSGNGSNSSGWSGLPGGMCEVNFEYAAGFSGYDSDGTWWSASESGGFGGYSDSWIRSLGGVFVDVGRWTSWLSYGYSARCVRD